MIATPKHFNWQLANRVATITLNRPERKNPLTFESYAELITTFSALNHEPEIRSVVITGAGGNFCSGGDVADIIGPLVEMAEKGDRTGLLRFTTMTGDLVKVMRACPQPIVSAIDGVCAGELVPPASCRAPTRSRRGSILLRTGRLSWLWAHGEETPVGAFGDPRLPGGTSYELCVLDASSAPQPRFGASVPPGGACAGHRCWRTAGGGRLDYDDGLGASEGLTLLRLKPGASGRARIQVRGGGPGLGLPPLPFVPPVVVQLHSSEGGCWGAEYRTPRRNEPGMFRARLD